MKFTESKIEGLLEKFKKKWTTDVTYRYASFDFCHAYFNSFNDKREIANDKNLEKSCLHLGFYLASWGMLRGSSFLLQKSLRFYSAIIEEISNTPQAIWDIDIDNYTESNIENLIDTYNKLSDHYQGNRRLTLTTKIMLGVYGNTPAFDDFFSSTFRKLYKGNGFRTFSKKSLLLIGQFYQDHKEIIDKYHNTTYCKDFITKKETGLKYKRAKVVDMIGFQYSFKQRQ